MITNRDLTLKEMRQIKVYLNGKIVPQCIAFDRQKGCVEVASFNKTGVVGIPQTLYGEITIKIESELEERIKKEKSDLKEKIEKLENGELKKREFSAGSTHFNPPDDVIEREGLDWYDIVPVIVPEIEKVEKLKNETNEKVRISFNFYNIETVLTLLLLIILIVNILLIFGVLR